MRKQIILGVYLPACVLLSVATLGIHALFAENPVLIAVVNATVFVFVAILAGGLLRTLQSNKEDKEK